MGLFDRLFKRRPRVEPQPPVFEPAIVAEASARQDAVATPDAAAPAETASREIFPTEAPPKPVVQVGAVEPDDPDDDLDAGEGDIATAWFVDAAAMDAAREEAERLALSGPQRITPNDPAGPGSLAQVLVELEARGLVTSQIVDDPELGFHVLYEPVKA